MEVKIEEKKRMRWKLMKEREGERERDDSSQKIKGCNER